MTTGRTPRGSRLRNVLDVGWRVNPTPLIDANMQNLLDAGLSRKLVELVMQTTDPESFLAATHVFQRPEKISREQAEEVWNVASMRFFNTMPDFVRTRDAFIRAMEDYGGNPFVALRSFPVWNSILETPFDDSSIVSSIKIATFLNMVETGDDRDFWISNEVASIVSLMWTVSLAATTDHGSYVKRTLMIRLAARIESIAIILDDPVTQKMAKSINKSISAVNLDPLLAKIVNNIGWPVRFLAPGSLPTFETAMLKAVSVDFWKVFVERHTTQSTTGNLSIRYSGWES